MTTNKPETEERMRNLLAERDAWHERAVMVLEKKNEWEYRARKAESDRNYLITENEQLRKVADQYRRLIEMGEDFQWENIIRVDISDFPSRADAIDAAMEGDQP